MICLLSNIANLFIKIQGFYLIFFRKRLRKRLQFRNIKKLHSKLKKISATLKNVISSANCIKLRKLQINA